MNAEAAFKQLTQFKEKLSQAEKRGNFIEARLQREEDLKKIVMDKKIDATQKMEDVKEDFEAKSLKKEHNRAEIISKQVLLSKLKKQNVRLQEERTKLEDENAHYIKENERFTKENAGLAVDIMSLIKHIEVSTLLKEVDTNEIQQMAKNNMEMSNAFQ